MMLFASALVLAQVPAGGPAGGPARGPAGGGGGSVRYGGRQSFQYNTRLLPSESRNVRASSGMLPSEMRNVRRQSGGLPGRGQGGVALRYPSYNRAYQQTANQIGSSGIRYHNINTPTTVRGWQQRPVGRATSVPGTPKVSQPRVYQPRSYKPSSSNYGGRNYFPTSQQTNSNIYGQSAQVPGYYHGQTIGWTQQSAQPTLRYGQQ